MLYNLSWIIYLRTWRFPEFATDVDLGLGFDVALVPLSETIW